MDNNNKLGLYVSYYLSRFDDEAYKNLGYGNQVETHSAIGEILSINPYTIKNWRDEFDPLFGHRAGWYQRPMIPSRLRIVQALENLDEPHIRDLVRDILAGRIQNEEDQLEQLLNIVISDDNKSKTSRFILRSPTGRQAEEIYLTHYSENKKPVDGKLIDCRDLGVGYDFKIDTNKEIIYIEVKGLSSFSGGILLTSKEWEVANAKGANYYLCLVSNINQNPIVSFLQNPAKKLNPKRNITTSIQISWSITEKQLAELND